MSLSVNKSKYIRSLKDKKFRNQYNCFVAEGEKLVFDLIGKCKCQILVALPEIIRQHPDIDAEEVIVASESELKKATLLKTAPSVIGVFYKPNLNVEIDYNQDITLVLDGIQDPGNLGTIVRIADWFGIKNIICSNDCADIFNPKTIQATMGSISRVKLNYTDIVKHLENNIDFPIYGTFMDGDNIYTENLTENGMIVMGSEGKGVSEAVGRLIKKRLHIPHYPNVLTGYNSPESLNVAVATSITCYEFRRKSFLAKQSF
ncbi:MAG TPA: RNA methyltransferase [Mariniphaga sp.]|nr:RNA methyltransferase [Mariniphaga sp.]